tara:strand:- start:972 stop:2090 length:1119 start_codon:yes stop_codon:yes gene_type:complete
MRRQDEINRRRSRNRIIPKEGAKAKDTGRSQQKAGGPPADAPVMFRYPLERLDDSVDALFISIFDQVRRSDIFGLGEAVLNEKGNINIEKIGGIQSYSDFAARLDKEGGEARKTKHKNAEYIYLPIPQQVSDALAVSYGDDTLNPVQAAGISVISSGLKDLSAGKDKPKDFTAVTLAQKIFEGRIEGIDQGTKDAIQSIFAGTAINALGANVNPNSLISRASGQILQSNLELLFSGVTLRSFPFVFDFVPREKREADQVRSIIRTLKKAMAPKSRNALFIQAPKVFQLEYVSGQRDHPFLNKFKLCSLTDMAVNYTASGTYATYEDGTPVHIQVQCTFKEINPIYAEDYEVEVMGPYKDPNEAVIGPGGVGF